MEMQDSYEQINQAASDDESTTDLSAHVNNFLTYAMVAQSKDIL